jgi:hypothetical protein
VSDLGVIDGAIWSVNTISAVVGVTYGGKLANTADDVARAMRQFSPGYSHRINVHRSREVIRRAATRVIEPHTAYVAPAADLRDLSPLSFREHLVIADYLYGLRSAFVPRADEPWAFAVLEKLDALLDGLDRQICREYGRDSVTQIPFTWVYGFWTSWRQMIESFGYAGIP